MAMKKSITRRWMAYGFSMIAAVLILVGAVCVGIAYNYYYTGVADVLEERAELYSRSAVLGEVPPEQWERAALRFVETFDNKEQMELQVLSDNGTVCASSTGFMSIGTDAKRDFGVAVSAADGRCIRQSRNGAGEHIMALTVLETSVDGKVVGALRYVVTLRLIDRQMLLVLIGICAVVLMILFFAALVSFYFIRSIVHPVEEIGRAARRIAKGEYGYRVKKYRNDELGELSDTINYMAGEIQRAEKLKNDFISSVSHELRTPLTAIRGWSETLQDTAAEDTALMAQGMQIITEETERLSSMVEELLDFSRMQNGKLTLRFEAVDISVILEETLLLFRERAHKNHITIHNAAHGHLPLISGDADRLRQVFINVLDNAIKYCDAGDTVRIDHAVMGDAVQVVIGDTGKGIAKEDLPQIKEKFYKADTTRAGSGIGLAVADEIIRGHGGTLEIHSKLGAGTSVIITLPKGKEV